MFSRCLRHRGQIDKYKNEKICIISLKYYLVIYSSCVSISIKSVLCALSGSDIRSCGGVLFVFLCTLQRGDK
jgi:hypothetical protein